MQKPWEKRKKQREEKEFKYIQDYEENLKLHYESKRKELDILLSSSLPHQISNIKMVLWINFLFLGIGAALFKLVQFHGLYLVSYLFSFFAIILMIVALTQRGAKYYGGIDDEDYVKNVIMDSSYPKSKMLAGLLHNTFNAIKYNRKTLHILSKYLRRSIYATFIAIITFSIFLLTFNIFLANNIESVYPKPPLISYKVKEDKIENNILKR